MFLKRPIPVFVLIAVLVAAVASAQAPSAPTPASGAQPPGGAAPQPGAATAQPATPAAAPRKWEVEVHGGLGSVLDRRAGSGSLPTTGALVQGLMSASTFFLGQGAALFNQNQSARGTGPAIVPLDSVLLGPAIERQRSWVAGARFDRSLTSRLGVEIAGEYRSGYFAFRPDALRGLETTRTSVKAALDGVLSRLPVSSSVATVTTITDKQKATQLVATGALIVKLKETGRVIPYLAVGGGVLANDSTTPVATVVGTYELGNPAQIIYSDNVVLRYREESRAFLGLAGGGVKVALSSRWGVRFDARANVYKNEIVNLVDVGAGTLLQSTGRPFPNVTSGTLQFSPLAPLTGSSFGNSTTFTPSGFQTHVVVSTGLFLRF